MYNFKAFTKIFCLVSVYCLFCFFVVVVENNLLNLCSSLLLIITSTSHHFHSSTTPIFSKQSHRLSVWGKLIIQLVSLFVFCVVLFLKYETTKCKFKFAD